jgi:hypothetical protein
VEAEPNEHSFKKIREALVASHTLTPFQQVDRIVTMDQLNGRKPSEFLTEMEKFRPAEDHHCFAYHFLQRMPREVRILLARDDCIDMRALAEKAEGLMALHLPQAGKFVVATTASPPLQHRSAAEEDETAAAVSRGSKKQPKKKFKMKKQYTDLNSPLCFFHIRYSDKAFKCEEPCAWPAEN